MAREGYRLAHSGYVKCSSVDGGCSCQPALVTKSAKLRDQIYNVLNKAEGFTRQDGFWSLDEWNDDGKSE